MSSCKWLANGGVIAHVDLLKPDDHEEERCVHVTVHDENKA